MDIVKEIEQGLGRERLQKLKHNEDNYQIFWLGVLEHRKKVDWSRDPIPYLISCGYGAIRNERLKENSRMKVKFCDSCGKVFPYRYGCCPVCYGKGRTIQRVLPITRDDGTEQEFEDKHDFTTTEICRVDILAFIRSLSSRKEKYIAHRWLIDRVDLLYDNHCKQLAIELGCSAPYIAKVKQNLRIKYKRLIGR